MRILVTGGAGFIGAWIARGLLTKGHAVRIFDLGSNKEVVEAIAGREAACSDWVTGTIADGAAVEAAARGCDAIVHLAGLLTTTCQANPVLGAEVNIIGTLNVFNAARNLGIRRIVYTSSAAVFGPKDGKQPRPTTHYGAFKLACEGAARAYLEDHGLGSVGFRPFVVYGPGRETGLTAGPTLACRAAARAEAYTIGYRGAAGMIYVEDVAEAYCAALMRDPVSAEVYNLVGEVATTEEVVAAIREIVPDARIATGGPDLPFTPDIPDGDVFEKFPMLHKTTLRDGIARTIEHYRMVTGRVS